MAASTCGCDAYHDGVARFLDAVGRPAAALRHYERAADGGSGLRRVEAGVRAGEILARTFQRCPEARRRFEAAAREAASGPWAERARLGLMSCPDYFPVEPGRRWIYGDSASLGRAMRLVWDARVSSDGAKAQINGQYFAGSKLALKTTALYERRDWVLWERAGASSRPILRFPYRAGQSWQTGRGAARVTYRIDGDDALATTRAGSFPHCLKVREARAASPDAWKYDYYAPGVGKVKTTVAGPGYENPNTELLSYVR